jgi:carnitine O-acetyltransferase
MILLDGLILTGRFLFPSYHVQKLILNNETMVLDFDFYGRKHIKSWEFSPDAFVQMAFQLAHYRFYRTLAATYESASTKQFLHGRTETGRSVSNESVEFLKTMLNPQFKVQMTFFFASRVMNYIQ